MRRNAAPGNLCRNSRLSYAIEVAVINQTNADSARARETQDPVSNQGSAVGNSQALGADEGLHFSDDGQHSGSSRGLLLVKSGVILVGSSVVVLLHHVGSRQQLLEGTFVQRWLLLRPCRG